MKKTVHGLQFILPLFFVALTVSCLENGATGPMGENGVDGEDGNINVIMKMINADSGEYLN